MGMGKLCYFVWKTEKASAAWNINTNAGRRSNAGGESMSSKMFWQSLWYLFSFYMTWVPYLILQYVWASGHGYTAEWYGFSLFACTCVPLQGLWNAIVYFRRKTKAKINDMFTKMRSRTGGTAASTNRDSQVNAASAARTRLCCFSAQEVVNQTESSAKKTAASAVSHSESAVSRGPSTAQGNA